MPFDSLSNDVLLLDRRHMLIAQRRQNAAALWRAIPAKHFDLNQFASGKSACALGWLARLQHDNWRSSTTCGIPLYCEPQLQLASFEAAAFYFRMGIEDTYRHFGTGIKTCVFYNRRYICEITPDDVASKMLAYQCVV